MRENCCGDTIAAATRDVMTSFEWCWPNLVKLLYGKNFAFIIDMFFASQSAPNRIHQDPLLGCAGDNVELTNADEVSLWRTQGLARILIENAK